ncbi:MAG: amino acid permease [Acidobacteria bacterium]|nr:amino acid permease [Acidobacteriota bacterium]
MSSPENRSGLRREMGFWDVLLFNIAAVLGPRWIAAAAHNGVSSLSLWALAALLFFFPTALIIVELSTRFPNEGGLYVWTKEAFGDFHGFVAGWSYWVYTIFYFPGLLLASVAMSVYIGGPKAAWLADNRPYQMAASLALLAIAVGLNLVGLHIGKWLQNAGGVGTYVPLVMLVAVGGILWLRHGSATAFTWSATLPRFNFDTVNFWSQIAFAFTGLELVCAMSEEVRNPQRNFPRAIYASGALIAAIYIMGTLALLAIIPAGSVNVQNGVFQALGSGSAAMGLAWLGIIAALLVTVGNAGGVGSTVAGVARVPFVVGLDRYLPQWFGKLHPKWRTPYIAILVQGAISAVVLLLSQVSETLRGAYQVLVDAAILLYFLPFLYMYAAAMRLAFRRDRNQNPGAVLVPGGKAGVIIAGGLAFTITAFAMALALYPTADVANKALFEIKLVGETAGSVLIGLFLYWRGARGSHKL